MLEAGPLKYDDPIEAALVRLQSLLLGDYRLSKRAIGLLLLQEDPEIERLIRVREQEGPRAEAIAEVVAQLKARYHHPLRYFITLRRHEEARRILSAAVAPLPARQGGRGRRFAEGLSRATTNPLTGIPILLLILYFGLYQFVGVFGAGTLVGFLENTVFGEWINPRVSNLVTSIIPFQVLRELFVGEYGVITLGLTYAIAIILPIVSTFFIVFSLIEDTGYLPRLALLIDRLFKKIGLSGRAVIPMVLGFGCDTMATIVTRTQETKRERVIATLLLALAIPCSAQLGVIFGVLSGNPRGLLLWGGTVALVFLLVGYLAAKLLPGERPSFYMEVPPLRLPQVSNVLAKTYTRMQWYFLEVLPIFLFASLLIWIGQVTGLFPMVVAALEPLVGLIGLPQEAAAVFLFGFFRRDFGAAGLYSLNDSGVLLGVPLVVAAVTLTLFIPCIAQFSVMTKERGVKTALAIALFIFPFAFLVGFLLNLTLTSLGVAL